MTDTIKAVPARRGFFNNWPRWAPYAALAWSLAYAVLGLYWSVNGGSFPYAPNLTADSLGPIIGRFGSAAAWVIVTALGLPAAVVAIAMLRGVRGKLLRPLLITAGGLFAGILLLLMTGLDLLIKVGYLPAALFGLFSSEKGQAYLAAWSQWTTIHQLVCLLGGFTWLAATVSYARQSVDACLYCGRREASEGWSSPANAARWGRIAVYAALVAPVFYAFTRYAWAAGIPLGMTREYWRLGQERGTWIAGLSLATFGLVGGLLMLGLVQRWGSVFPRWIPGLSGRRVPIALAVVPAALVSVLLFVGGIGIWFVFSQMVTNLTGSGVPQEEIIGGIIFQLGPTLLFPLWGAALAMATLGYYYRRRGPCRSCGRGSTGDDDAPGASSDNPSHLN